MATTFPTTIDDFTNPSAGDKTDSPSHAGQHADINDAVEALEAKVGVDSSAVATSHDYKLANLTVSDITDLTATAAELNTLDGITADVSELNKLDGLSGDVVGTSDTQTLTNKTITPTLKRQNSTSNTTVANNTIVHGWGQIEGDNSTDISESVTFPDAFSAEPIVLLSYIGGIAGGSASDPGDFVTGTTGSSGNTTVTLASTTTTGFTVYMGRNSSNFSSGNYYGYSWIAIGVLA